MLFSETGAALLGGLQEKAVFQLDIRQLRLVFEALAERRSLLDNAPHLTRALPILTVSAPPARKQQGLQHARLDLPRGSSGTGLCVGC